MTEEERKAKRREICRRYREANREKIREQNRRYRARNPESCLESQRRWRRGNLEKRREMYNNSYKANPEYFREISRNRRARKLDQHGILPVTAEVIAERFEVFGHRCAYCGAEHQLTVDHFIALNLGGTHAPTNLVPACPRCNYSKRHADPEEWYRAQPFFDEKRWKQIQKATGHSKAPGQLSLI